ncbi:MAG: RNA polymerase sigma factor [Patescibacteria group bacterium]
MTDGLERGLAARCRQGDAKAFGELYDLHFRKIYDFIYYKTHHRETAQDLASETFFKALKSISSFDPDRGSFSSWIYRIARNTVTDHYRTSRAHLNIDDAWDLASGSDTAADVDALMKVSAVREALQRLKPEQRDIVILRVWQELSYQEIAAALGKSEASCKMSFSRSVRELRASLPLNLLIALLLPALWNR